VGQLDIGPSSGSSSAQDDGSGLTCTGVLIGPDTVLTAAHCVWDAWRGGFYGSLHFAAGRHNASGCSVSSPFGAVPWRDVTIFGQFADALEPDLAVVRLAAPVGRYTGWAGVQATACGDAKPLRMELVGYGGGAEGAGSDDDGASGGGGGGAGVRWPAGSCTRSFCDIRTACSASSSGDGGADGADTGGGAATVQHMCDAQPGQSGSPMMGSGGYVRLVHSAGTLLFDAGTAGGGNAATLLTPSILAALAQW
jgi:hypothetical protein